jgi:hypothetical protein
MVKWMYSFATLDRGFRCGWVFRFTAPPFPPPRKSPLYPLKKKLDGPQNGSGIRVVRNIFLPPGIESGRPAFIPSLYRLRSATFLLFTNVFIFICELTSIADCDCIEIYGPFVLIKPVTRMWFQSTGVYISTSSNHFYTGYISAWPSEIIMNTLLPNLISTPNFVSGGRSNQHW